MALRHRSWLDLCGHRLKIHQMTNDIKMALMCCDPQWRCAIVRGLIFVGTNFHQMTNDIKMAFMCCHEQWRCAIVRSLIFVSTCFNQQLQAFNMSSFCGTVQRCCAMSVSHIWIQRFFQQTLKFNQFIVGGCRDHALGLLSIRLEKIQDHKHKLHWRRSKNLIIRDLGTIF